MSQAPVSVSIFIGDIPEEDTTEIFDYLRKTGSNFSFTVGDVYVEEEEVVKEPFNVLNVFQTNVSDGSCPTCIFGVDHEGECGPAWDPTDNR